MKENLFVIDLINDEEKLLEKQLKDSNERVMKKEEELSIYRENLENLEH